MVTAISRRDDFFQDLLLFRELALHVAFERPGFEFLFDIHLISNGFAFHVTPLVGLDYRSCAHEKEGRDFCKASQSKLTCVLTFLEIYFRLGRKLISYPKFIHIRKYLSQVFYVIEQNRPPLSTD